MRTYFRLFCGCPRSEELSQSLRLYCHDVSMDLIDGRDGSFLQRVTGLAYACFCRHLGELSLGSHFGLFRLAPDGQMTSLSQEPISQLASRPDGQLMVLQSEGYFTAGRGQDLSLG